MTSDSEFERWYIETFRRPYRAKEEHFGVDVMLAFQAGRAHGYASFAAEEVERVKLAIGKVFVPSGVWNIEEGWKLERAAKAAIAALSKEDRPKVDARIESDSVRYAFEQCVEKRCAGIYSKEKELRRKPNGNYWEPLIFSAFEGFKDGYKSSVQIIVEKLQTEAARDMIAEIIDASAVQDFSAPRAIQAAICRLVRELNKGDKNAVQENEN